MTAHEDYIKGICFFSGYRAPCVSFDTGTDYLTRAANGGDSRAKNILNSTDRIYYALLDGTILGIQPAYSFLKNSSQNRYIGSTIPAGDIQLFERAIRQFTPRNVDPNFTDDDLLEFGLRYFVGDMTGRKNKTKGREWLQKAAKNGNRTAIHILSEPYTEEQANVEAVLRYGSIRALNRVTGMHKNGTFPIPDSDLIEFAKTVIRMGNNL